MAIPIILLITGAGLWLSLVIVVASGGIVFGTNLWYFLKR